MFTKNLAMLTPIKINLALHVIGQTNYNYLLLDSLVIFSQQGDELKITTNIQNEFYVTGSYAWQLQNEQDNLITKARDLLRNYALSQNKKIYSIKIELIKNLPVASGLGGGSGDAATTLILLNEIWNLNLKESVLLDLAKLLGADVPCCVHYLLHKTALYMSGIGEIIDPVNIAEPLIMLVVNNLEKTSTKEVCSNITNKHNSPIDRCYNFSNSKELINFLLTTRNDLLHSALKITPSIAEVLNILKRYASFSVMSGSGASCVGIFKTKNEATTALDFIRRNYPNWFISLISS